jgi:hypothetical protein
VSSDDLAALETNSPKPLPGPSADLRSKIVALHVPSHDATEYLRARDGRFVFYFSDVFCEKVELDFLKKKKKKKLWGIRSHRFIHCAPPKPQIRQDVEL